MRPSLFFHRHQSSSEGGLTATLVGSPPRFDAGVTVEASTQQQVGDMRRDAEDYSTAST
jgi:hypothetical protein